jgi:geranylgeranylglycerol-phosphate geranylgeranyltransferase
MSILQSSRMERNTQKGKAEETLQASFLRSQLILFQSRKKWGIMYSLATVTGILCLPGVLDAMSHQIAVFSAIQTLVLPIITLLISTGMYILNDLIDSDLDRANGKKRPIPSGIVSKRQAWAFVIILNGTAAGLSLITFNPVSIAIVAVMLTIGILYSARRVALENRFVIKTLSIALFYMLCALLGMTSGFGMNIVMANPLAAVRTVALLGTMIFISSTLNDLGDVEGDRAASRRTIPIVIGEANTVKMAIVLSAGIAVMPWIFFALNYSGIMMPISASLFGLFVATRLVKIKNGLGNMEFMRSQHKKLFPMHLVLQSIISSGTIMI